MPLSLAKFFALLLVVAGRLHQPTQNFGGGVRKVLKAWSDSRCSLFCAFATISCVYAEQ
jgi:hypothetical protein